MGNAVVVLGGTGMLGSMCVDVLAREPGLKVRATARAQGLIDAFGPRAPEVSWSLLDALTADAAALGDALGEAKWVVNAIGLTKPYIHDDDAAEVERAVRVNALFAHLLARAAAERGARVLQIATDCVYSGAAGAYVESAPHDALDAYGKTKSLGEVRAPCMHHLRCSIVGPEPKGGRFLLHWFLSQPQGGQVGGYTNHLWNGLTTLHFARLCAGVVRYGLDLPGLQHVVPADVVTKCELLGCFAKAFGRTDVVIEPTQADKAVDRSLASERLELGAALWRAADYPEPPTVAAMVQELAQFRGRFDAAQP